MNIPQGKLIVIIYKLRWKLWSNYNNFHKFRSYKHQIYSLTILLINTQGFNVVSMHSIKQCFLLLSAYDRVHALKIKIMFFFSLFFITNICFMNEYSIETSATFLFHERKGISKYQIFLFFFLEKIFCAISTKYQRVFNVIEYS